MEHVNSAWRQVNAVALESIGREEVAGRGHFRARCGHTEVPYRVAILVAIPTELPLPIVSIVVERSLSKSYRLFRTPNRSNESGRVGNLHPPTIPSSSAEVLDPQVSYRPRSSVNLYFIDSCDPRPDCSRSPISAEPCLQERSRSRDPDLQEAIAPDRHRLGCGVSVRSTSSTLTLWVGE